MHEVLTGTGWQSSQGAVDWEWDFRGHSVFQLTCMSSEAFNWERLLAILSCLWSEQHDRREWERLFVGVLSGPQPGTTEHASFTGVLDSLPVSAASSCSGMLSCGERLKRDHGQLKPPLAGTFPGDSQTVMLCRLASFFSDRLAIKSSTAEREMKFIINTHFFYIPNSTLWQFFSTLLFTAFR